MSEVILSDYFYGDESEQFIYFRIPRLLITSPRFKHLSTDAKLLYGMLLDRMSLAVFSACLSDHRFAGKPLQTMVFFCPFPDNSAL